MIITTEEVERIAKLIKLKFTPEEVFHFANQLSGIMTMISELNEVDCTDVKPLTSVCEMTQPMRRDEIAIGDISEELFINTPGASAEFAREIKCFIVPKVVE
jgi:aspartyl-tRNA(Asn)/glutamyl-tRNA(Gln) amidotransferase subunit C